MKTLTLSAWILLFTATTTHAGSLKNGLWTTSKCGSLSAAPMVNDSSVDAYNNSVAAINNWQQASSAYLDCMVKEANADNNAIAEAANKEQANYRQIEEMLKAALAEAGARLNNR